MTVDQEWMKCNLGFDPCSTRPLANTGAFAPTTKKWLRARVATQLYEPWAAGASYAAPSFAVP